MARLCPHCETRAKFTDGNQNIGKWGKPESAYSVLSRNQICQECGGLITVFMKGDDSSAWKEFIVYPASIPSVNNYVPKTVTNDYVSAINCLSISEYKAAAAMFRRSLQQIMIDKQASTDKLFSQIDDLAKKGVITNEIKEWAHQIRYLGNDGAHPTTDYLDEITEDEILEVKEFLERVFDYVYIMPGKLKASIQSRNNKKNNSP